MESSRLPLHRPTIPPHPQDYKPVLIRAYKTRQPDWKPIYKDPQACKNSPTYNVLENPPPRDSGIVSVKGNSIDISELEVGEALHDTCSLVTIKNDQLGRVYVLKSAKKHRYIRRMLMREMEILCTIPLHKNIMGRPAFLATVQWAYAQESFNAAQMPNLVDRTFIKGEAIVGYMTEYIPSGTLAKQLLAFSHENPLKSEIGLSWCLQLCEALIHLHRVCGLAHSALKPDNVLVDTTDKGKEGSEYGDAGRIVLIDFEQTKTWEEFEGPLVYRLGRRLRSDNPLESCMISEQSDIHSLACIFWMIFECKGIFDYACACTDRVIDTTIKFFRAKIRWFHNTPVSLRQILASCTGMDEYHISHVSLEALRDAVAEAYSQAKKATECGPMALKTATACLCTEPAEMPPPDSILPSEATTTSSLVSAEASSPVTLDTITPAYPVHAPAQTITTCSHEEMVY
ncbi:kinase-like domain-containing protein [Terfezia claveryi]|nr:kinase-like domain-containing protein [Terfezia claveryi]